MRRQFFGVVIAALPVLAAGVDNADVERFHSGIVCVKCDLRYESAVGKVAAGGDFRGAYMFNINLTRSRFVDANLQSANLQEAILDKADFSRAKMETVQLTGASMTGVTMTEAKMRQSTLSDAVLNFGDVSQADLSTSTLRRVKFYNGFAAGTNFASARLTGGVFRNSYFFRANMVGAIADKTDFDGADFSNANLGQAILTNADLSNTNFSFANLDGANLQGAKLVKANLSGANLSNVDLTDADLTDAEIDTALLINVTACRTKVNRPIRGAKGCPAVNQ